MIDNNNHIHYSAEAIQQYLSGKLTPLQMHAMEKAALDDPFLAEAIEGYQSVAEEDWRKALAKAKEELYGQHDTGARVIAMPTNKFRQWRNIAAALLVIVTVAAVSYWMINKKEQQQIAQTIPAEVPQAPATITPDTAAPAIAVLPPAVTATKEEKKPYPAAVTPKVAVAAEMVADSNFVYRPPADKAAAANEAKAAEDIAQERKQADAAAPPAAKPAPVTMNNVATNAAAESNTQSAYYKNNAATQGLFFDQSGYAVAKKEIQKDQPLNRNFLIQVVGPDNTPLPFANVSIKSENFGTYADVKGNLRLVSSDSLLNVEVKSAGYQPKVYTIKSNLPQNKITLVEDDMMARQKTVVSSSAFAKAKTSSRRATLVTDSIVNVEPADGWDNYNTYVDNNIEIPDDILKNNIHGQVELSFEVKSNGTITNIRIDKSLCNDCDEVAKRLIEQGPQWKVKKGKKGKGKVTVQF